MRILVVLLLGAAPAFPQFLSLGVKGGMPFTDFIDGVNTGRVNFTTTTNRYLVGPTAELHLPAGFSLEVDALYRHFNYASSSFGVDLVNYQKTTASSWEFPILLKYRFPFPLVKPFVDGGVAFNSLSGVNQTISSTLAGSRLTTTTNTNNPAQLNENNTMGLVVGAGVEVHALFLRVSPEVRYTRWTNQQFRDINNLLHSNLNQAEFLVGFTF